MGGWHTCFVGIPGSVLGSRPVEQVAVAVVGVALIAGLLAAMLALRSALVRARRAERELSGLRDDLQRLAERRSVEEELRRANLQLEAANRELEAFSYSVSHDLRAPLRAITGFSEALAEDCGDRLPAGAEVHLGRIRGAAERMGALIDDLLALSRATRVPMRLDEVDLSRIAEEIVGQLRAEEPHREVEIRVGQGLVAYGDRQLLRTLLENLLRNAWKFTGGRSPARIELERLPDTRAAGIGEAGKDVYVVRDDGVGFDMAHAGRLFRPFQRLHPASDFPGSGIGLATVQRVVRRHGGRVWIESRPAEGTTVFFTLA